MSKPLSKISETENGWKGQIVVFDDHNEIMGSAEIFEKDYDTLSRKMREFKKLLDGGK